MEWLVVIWVLVGWFCASVSTPRWMLENDPVWYFFMGLFCGAVVGPFGVFWFFDRNSAWRDKW